MLGAVRDENQQDGRGGHERQQCRSRHGSPRPELPSSATLSTRADSDLGSFSSVPNRSAASSRTLSHSPTHVYKGCACCGRETAVRLRFSEMQDALRRLSHPHYLACSLLCLPFPLVLAITLRTAHDLSSTLTTALLAAPVLLALSVAVRKPSDNIGRFRASARLRRPVATPLPDESIASRSRCRIVLRDDDVPAPTAQLIRVCLYAQAAWNRMARRPALLCRVDGRVPLLPPHQLSAQGGTVNMY